MWWLLKFCFLLALINFTKSIEKIPFKPGTICNFEAYYSEQTKVINKFFCVPASRCRRDVQRFPLMRYDGCERYMKSPERDFVKFEKLVCCHQEEIFDFYVAPLDSPVYLPGVRSFMMCKHHLHAICGPKGSYCKSDDDPDEQSNHGLPTQISKYPHTALIGYFHQVNRDWTWVCQGSIVSDSYILTVWSCNNEDGPEPASNVKIGESRICPVEHCPERDEEQNLDIVAKYRQASTGDRSHDLALFRVYPAIKFNKNVRPACLHYELFTRQAQGWFARYGKPEMLVKTIPGKRPIFMRPKDERIIAFKVKATEEARIMFSKSGLPYKKEFKLQVVLGSAQNAESMITRSDLPSVYAPTPINITTGILNGNQFRGFWIQVQPHEIKVGKEGSADSFLIYNDDATEFVTSAMGLSTPNTEGEWVIYDYESLASLHAFEMEVTYDDDCKDGPKGTDNTDDSVFCAMNAAKKFRPCENDSGGAIQIVEDIFFCMWQIFGVYLRDNYKNCSAVEKPTLFKQINSPGTLAWIEDIAFSDFYTSDVELEQPACTDLALCFEPGRRCVMPDNP